MTQTAQTRREAEPQVGLADVLVRLAHLVDHLFSDSGRERDLTPQQAQLLCVLAAEPVGMTELSSRLHLGRSSLTGLVDRVEKRGLVERIPDSTDRRALSIAVTDEGARLAEVIHDEISARLESLAGDLSATTRANLVDGVTQVLARHVPSPPR